MLKYLLALSVLFTLTSCYQMPGDDVVSTIPITNNPNIVPQKRSGAMPGMKM